ncbi:hypothetical protein HK104_009104 [Borealophlyctis nickersoniae]|nr:hypothetical protein HK104_009104 [Borealophlyctis nickersoniae]
MVPQETTVALSPALQALLSTSSAVLTRSALAQSIWLYIRTQGLVVDDEGNVYCDNALERVCGEARVHVLLLMELIGARSRSSPVSATPTRPTPSWPEPDFSYEIRDTSPTGKLFSKVVPDPCAWFPSISRSVLGHLYSDPLCAPTCFSYIHVVIRDFEGVAYCCDVECDNRRGKEIHLSTRHLKNIAGRDALVKDDDEADTTAAPAEWKRRLRWEIDGVICHETVHAWQRNGNGTAPGGLIEGIADYVRLRAGLAPPHWVKGKGGKWDDGYSTTGYFLAWIEDNSAHPVEGFVRNLNFMLQDSAWDDGLFEVLAGKGLEALWEEYQASFGEDGKELTSEQLVPVPTEGATLNSSA